MRVWYPSWGRREREEMRSDRVRMVCVWWVRYLSNILRNYTGSDDKMIDWMMEMDYPISHPNISHPIFLIPYPKPPLWLVSWTNICSDPLFSCPPPPWLPYGGSDGWCPPLYPPTPLLTWLKWDEPWSWVDGMGWMDVWIGRCIGMDHGCGCECECERCPWIVWWIGSNLIWYV